MCKDSEKSSKAQKGSKDLSKEGNKLVFVCFYLNEDETETSVCLRERERERYRYMYCIVDSDRDREREEGREKKRG